MTEQNAEENEKTEAADELNELEAPGPPPEQDPEALRRSCGELAQERDMFRDKYQRALADLQNYHRRSLREREEAVERTRVDTIEQFLFPVIDDLDRAIQSAQEHGYDQADPLFAGLTLVRQRMLELLKQYGIEPIDALGKPFDPLYHKAMMDLPSAEHPEGAVIGVVSRGYLVDGKTIRPARVVVAKKTNAKDNNPEKVR